MKEIIVLSERFGRLIVKVDDSDYEYLNRFNWNASESKGNIYISARSVFSDNKLRKVKIHQLIMNHFEHKKLVIDHIDRDTLNNTRSNLRIVTWQQNNLNRRPQRGKISKYKGVSKSHDKFVTEIMVNGKRIRGGRFISEQDAAKKYNELARQYHGEFAYQNPV